MKLRTLDDISVQGKRVLMRADFNVPLKDGVVQDESRITATLPTIRKLVDEGVTLVLMSHLGRPKGAEDKYRLGPVAKRLSEHLGTDVRYLATEGAASDEQAKFVADAPEGSITLLENLRFDSRETKNNPEFAKILASYGDVFISDAFGAAHRAHASTEGVAHLLPSAAGLLLAREVSVLGNLLEAPEKPFKVILGGAKVSDKIGVMTNLINVVDEILVGGAMAYTFFKAQGGNVGKSLVEDDKLDVAKDILEQANAKGVTVRLPQDSLCATEIAEGVDTAVYPSNDIPDGYIGLDAGPDAIQVYKDSLANAKTVLWNGPLGVFETSPFDRGTKAIAETVAALDGYVVIGGGDSVAAINAVGLADKIDHISTGGGASLELLEGKTLPGIAVLLVD
ncbi:MAG: phosphoglycerate kinase [Deinococcota bacterium]